MKVQIGIVEDNPRTLQRFATALSACGEWHIALTSATFKDAYSTIPALKLDVLLLDLGLPDGDGIELISHVLHHHPECHVLIISVFGDEENVIRCIEKGATGYLLKGQGDDELAEHLNDLLNGGSPMSPQIARGVLKQLREHVSPLINNSDASLQKTAIGTPLLTAKELLVLKDLEIGHTYGEVALLRQMSVNTVRHHVKSIYSKLYVKSRTQAINEASRMGIL